MKNIIILACVFAIAFSASSFVTTYTDDTVCTGLTVTGSSIVTTGTTDVILVADCTADTALASGAYYNAACSYYELDLTIAASGTSITFTKYTATTVTGATVEADFSTSSSLGTCAITGSSGSGTATCTGATSDATKDTWVSANYLVASAPASVNAWATTKLTCNADESSASEVTLGLSALAAVLF